MRIRTSPSTVEAYIAQQTRLMERAQANGDANAADFYAGSIERAKRQAAQA